MRVHKYANYFPIIEGEEFEMLCKDIKENGQNEPVIMFHGEILDGVNRTRACQELGIEPITKEYEGDDPLKYVISSNIRRRHLDTSQRAMLATEMLPEFEAEARSRHGKNGSVDPDVLVVNEQGEARARDQVGKVFGVSGVSVRRAKRVKEEAPEKVEEIIKGKTTVTAVDAELRADHAADRATKKKETATDKEVEANKRFVAEYFQSIKQFVDEIDLAIVGAKRDKFDPSASNFVKTKHDKVRDLMTELEELI